MAMQFFSLEGRATLREFQKASALFILLSIVSGVAFSLSNKGNFLFLKEVFSLLFLFALIPVTVRRLHDIGKSGALVFVLSGSFVILKLAQYLLPTEVYLHVSKVAFLFAPLSLYVFTLLLRAGNVGPNEYGADLKQVTVSGSSDPSTATSTPSRKVNYSLIILIVTWIVSIPVLYLISIFSMFVYSGFSTHQGPISLWQMAMLALLPLTVVGMIFFTFFMIAAIRRERNEG